MYGLPVRARVVSRFGDPWTLARIVERPDIEEETIETGLPSAADARFGLRIGASKSSKDRVPATVRLVLASIETPVLSRLERLLGREKDFEIIACCGKGKDVLFAVSALYPDVLVLALPPAAAADGLELVRQMQAKEFPTRVVFLCKALREDQLQEAVRFGVQAVVPGNVAPAVLVHCIRDIHGSGPRLGYQPASPASATPRKTDTERRNEVPALTRREAEVVRLVCVGLPNKQIAARLETAEGTVKTHLHRIYAKLEVQSRLELSLYGRANRP